MALDVNSTLPYPSGNGKEPAGSTSVDIHRSEDQLIQTLSRRRRKSLSIRMTDEERHKLTIRIIQDFWNSFATHKAFILNHVQFLKNWRGMVEEKPTGPIGTKSANLKVPLTGPFKEQWQARLIEALLGGERIVEFESLDMSLYQRDQLMELSDWFDWELKNIVHIDEALEEIIHYTLLDGWAVPIPSWEKRKKTLLTVREFEIMDSISFEDQIDMVLKELFKGRDVRDIVIVENGIYDVTTGDNRELTKPTRVTFSLDDEILCAEMEEEVYTIDGVQIYTPNVEDIILLNSHWDLEKIPFFGMRYWIKVEDFKRECKKGGMFEGLSQNDIDRVAGYAYEKRSDFIPQPYTIELDLEEGTDSRAQLFHGDRDRLWIEIYRWESNITLNDKEIGLICWVAARAQIMLAMRRLEELNKDGLRTPVKFDFIRQYGRFYSIGLAEWVQHSQAEMDGIHNQRLDSGLVSTVPFGFYTPAAGQPKNILQLEPGKMYPVKNPDAIVFPKIGWNPTWGFEEEGLSRKYASENAGVGDPGLGTFTSKRLSAAEFSGTSSAIELMVSMRLRTFSRSFTRLLERIFGLYQQFAKSSRLYQVTTFEGEELVKSLATDRLHGKIKLRLTANVQQISSQLERDLAVNTLQLLLNQVLLQMGIVKPTTIYQAMKRVMRAMKMKGIQIFPPDEPPMSLPPDEEHKAMLRGEQVQPSLNENHEEHLAVHTRLAAAPNLMQLIPDPIIRQELQRHILVTSQMKVQADMIRKVQAAQAMQMQMQMAQMGIRPGLAGSSQAGGQATPGTQEEGVPTGRPEQMGTMGGGGGPNA